MTPTERLILENQIAIMSAITDLSISEIEFESLSNAISGTRSFLNKSQGDGEH